MGVLNMPACLSGGCLLDSTPTEDEFDENFFS